MRNIKKFNEKFNINSNNIKVTDKMTRVWISNKKFKNLHIRNIGEILYKVYKPIDHWKKKPGGFYGVMNLEWDNEPWSLLNRINTNYTALSIIINSINDTIENGNSNTPKFNLVASKFGSDEFYEEYDRFMNYCKRFAKNIFLKTTKKNGSSVINNIVNAIGNIQKVGDNAEKFVVKFLPKLNKNISNIRLPDGSGDRNDMIDGTDVFFNFKNKTFTIQVKKVRKIENIKEGDMKVYKTKGASISKHYKTDYYAILNDHYLYFFNNDSSKIKLSSGELEFPEDLLIKRFLYV